MAPNAGLPTSLRFAQIAYGDFGNPKHVRYYGGLQKRVASDKLLVRTNHHI
jgi:hypothetical protein